MSSVLEKIPSMTQQDLDALRRNALRILESATEAKKLDYAEEVLSAIDEQLERRYLPGMIKTFRNVYPGGFYGEKQAVEEREYKLAACHRFQELLSQPVYADLMEAEDYSEIYNRCANLVGMTNLIQGSFEKPQLLDSIRRPEHADKFFPALFSVLYGDAAIMVRFGEWCSVLTDLELSKWTYATYFLFLSNPEKYMFVKPEMLKKSISLCRYPLEYESQPSAELYSEVLAYSNWLKSKIAELKPRDMIDVHSFMWHMAPTGKWAENE
ncbi:MAG: hypothetical protein H6985_18495 [Pseudomonadales bacterium]|nr:hypothetical protein [Pseudomonadales bacterium]